MKLGVQTYTIRKIFKKDLLFAFDELVKLGIHDVELARVDLNNDLIATMNKKKMNVLSIQLKLKEINKNYEKLVHFCKQVNCNIVVVSVLSLDAILFGKKAVIRFCNRLNELSKKYEKHGITIAFHHHNFEFKMITKKTKLDIIMAHTNEQVKLVTDTYWTKKSGIEPHELLLQYKERIIGIHLRDYMKNSFRFSTDCEVGYGLIDFNLVFENIPESLRYMVIEQNSNYPIHSLTKSIKYLKEHHSEKINL